MDLAHEELFDELELKGFKVSAGQLGAEPMPNSDFLTLINAQGRLNTVEEFGNIVLKSGEGGEIWRLQPGSLELLDVWRGEPGLHWDNHLQVVAG